jgi:hypothetical protein
MSPGDIGDMHVYNPYGIIPPIMTATTFNSGYTGTTSNIFSSGTSSTVSSTQYPIGVAGSNYSNYQPQVTTTTQPTQPPTRLSPNRYYGLSGLDRDLWGWSDGDLYKYLGFWIDHEFSVIEIKTEPSKAREGYVLGLFLLKSLKYDFSMYGKIAGLWILYEESTNRMVTRALLQLESEDSIYYVDVKEVK